MKEWFSSTELIGICSFPTTERWVRDKAKKEKWLCRERKGQGGGKEYHISSFPEKIQATLMLRELKHGLVTPKTEEKPTAPKEEKQIPNEGSNLNGIPIELLSPFDTERKQAQRMEKRNLAWEHYEKRPQKIKEEAEKRLKAVQNVKDLVRTGVSVEVARQTVSDQIGESVMTLFRWEKRTRGVDPGDWLPALCPNWAGRQVEAEISDDAWEWFKADYLRLEAPTAEACYRRLMRVASVKGWKLPSCKSLIRRIRREISPMTMILAREGQRTLESIIPSQERDHSVFHALEAVNSDGHIFDIFVEWENGDIDRPCMSAFQDIYSGLILSYRIDKTINSDAVRLSFGDMVEKYGIPDEVYFDNGREFANKVTTGGATGRHRFKIKQEDPIGLLPMLGVKIHWVTVAHGQAKPIERAFRDMCEDIAKHPAFAGAYTGNSPMTKPENYKSRAVSIAEFEKIVETEIAAHNARQGRRSGVCQGKSFEQVFNESYARSPIKKATTEQRRLCLLAAECVTAGKKNGEIEIFGNRYWHESLATFRDEKIASRKVVVRFDPEHLQRPLAVYRLDGSFMCEAECVMRAGFNDAEAAKTHAKAKKHIVKAEKAKLAAERTLKTMEAARMLPEMAKPEPTPNPKIVRLQVKKVKQEVEEESAESSFDRAMDSLRKPANIIQFPAAKSA
ncbi:MAG: Mu transposase C-terminal domain-containing protein [Candidatus Riflebacteria bacterium]|nr:Mu transposase C-terminal domain-containing protein [Candidatus Riflebacteria bacterium]